MQADFSLGTLSLQSAVYGLLDASLCIWLCLTLKRMDQFYMNLQNPFLVHLNFYGNFLAISYLFLCNLFLQFELKIPWIFNSTYILHKKIGIYFAFLCSDERCLKTNRDFYSLLLPYSTFSSSISKVMLKIYNTFLIIYNKFYIFLTQFYYVRKNTEYVQHPPQNFVTESQNVWEGILKTIEFPSTATGRDNFH